MSWHSIKCKQTGNDCNLLYKENSANPSNETTYREIDCIDGFTSGDHIGLLLDYDEETWTLSKGGERVYKGQLDYDLKNTDLYICVGSQGEGSSIQLVTARKGMQSL